jgi:hypothetical protein
MNNSKINILSDAINESNNNLESNCLCCRNLNNIFINKKSKEFLCIDTIETNTTYDQDLINNKMHKKNIFNNRRIKY